MNPVLHITDGRADMENLFYVDPERIDPSLPIRIEGQEARHISRVLRFKEGDTLHISDGKGSLYECTVSMVGKGEVTARIDEIRYSEKPHIRKVIALGLIKKRDRLEFAVEKATELGAWEICLFESDHTERSKIRKDRIQSTVLSAFKQSKRKFLPEITYKGSLDEVFSFYAAHHTVMAAIGKEHRTPGPLSAKENLLLIGPEGGFSEREIKLAMAKKAEFVSLGENRLRAETAVTALLSQYLYTI